MTDLDIQQAMATGQAKLSTDSYACYLKDSYGIYTFCHGSRINCLLLYRWALRAWDNRPGAINPYALVGLGNLTRKLNEL